MYTEQANLSALIGRKLILAELPEGYMSNKYALTVGKEYKVLGMDGSCYVIEDDNGSQGHIYYGRFDLSFLN